VRESDASSPLSTPIVESSATDDSVPDVSSVSEVAEIPEVDVPDAVSDVMACPVEDSTPDVVGDVSFVVPDDPPPLAESSPWSLSDSAKQLVRAIPITIDD